MRSIRGRWRISRSRFGRRPVGGRRLCGLWPRMRGCRARLCQTRVHGCGWARASSTSCCGATGSIHERPAWFQVAGGMPKGADRLAPEIAAIIEGCIERFYLTRQKLSGAALFDAVEHDCRKAALKPPSLNAVRRRVAAKPVADVVRAREGAAVATQRFRPVPGSLKTSWPLDVLQMDHTPMD